MVNPTLLLCFPMMLDGFPTQWGEVQYRQRSSREMNQKHSTHVLGLNKLDMIKNSKWCLSRGREDVDRAKVSSYRPLGHFSYLCFRNESIDRRNGVSFEANFYQEIHTNRETLKKARG